MTFDLLIRARRAVVDGALRPASIAVRDGRIAAVGAHDAPADAAEVVELAADEVLLPGLVDSHVHVNEPGRTEWEGFASATRAAAAGGVTTIIDMPLNSIPPTCDVAALEIEAEGRRGAGSTSTSGSGAAPSPATRPTCARCTRRACSGSSASCCPAAWTSSRRWTRPGCERAMRGDRRLRRPADRARRGRPRDHRRAAGAGTTRASCASRPPAAEQRAIDTVLGAGRGRPAPGCTSLHLSSAAALPALARGPPPRGPGHRRDLPALPELGRGRHPGRRDPVQVLPADPGRRQPGRAVAGAPGRARSTAWCPTTRPAPRT